VVHTEIDLQRRLVVHTLTGKLTLNAGLEDELKAYDQSGYEPGFGIVWDLRGGETMIALHDMANLDSNIFKHINENRVGGRTAWVISSTFEESMVKLLYSEHNWSAKLQTFSTLEAATRWVTATTDD